MTGVQTCALPIWMTLLLINYFNINYNTAWVYAHDWSGRPIGFFGTIAFTVLIERRKVRILDTITVWTDFVTGAKPKPKADAEQTTEKLVN